MKLHPSHILRQAIAVRMPAAPSPGVSGVFNFPCLWARAGCGLIFPSSVGLQTFPYAGRVIASAGFMGFAGPKLFRGKLARLRRNLCAVSPRCPRRTSKLRALGAIFQNRLCAVTRLFSRCAQCQPFWVSPPREAAREAIAHVLRASRLEPNYPN